MYRSLNPRMIGRRAPHAADCAVFARFGFEAVVVHVGDLVGPRGAWSLPCATFPLPVDFRGTHARFHEGLATLDAHAVKAAAAGLARSTAWVLPGDASLAENDFAELMVARLAACADILHAHGIRLGLEFLAPATIRRALGVTYEGLSSLERMLDVVDAIGTDRSGIVLDAWHWYASGADPDAFAVLSDALLVEVHVNDAPRGVPREALIDNRRRLPGATGTIPLSTFFGGLRTMGYSGPVVVEPFDARIDALGDDEALDAVACSLDPFLPRAEAAA